MNEINLKPKHFEFIKILNRKERSLGEMGSKMGLHKYDIQRIFNKLERFGLVISRKEGRERLVKLTKKGKYLRDWK